MIMATHGHFDHILAAYALQLAYNIPFYMHEADAFLLKTMQSSAKHFLHIDVDPPPKLSEIHDLPFIHTPGHTPGSICLYFKKEGVIFTGDTLLGRTDFAYSDKIAHARSVSTIFSLPPETKVYPGHGEVGDTIGLWRTK